MNASDAFLMSSAWEGLPIVLLEASACGLPAVATNVGGNPEVVEDGQTGLLTPSKDPAALAAAMLRMMTLPIEDRQQLGLAARALVTSQFDIDSVVDRWESMYRDLLARKRGAR
jgi:glycosyltransferase involved in cell wall biosynthesis